MDDLMADQPLGTVRKYVSGPLFPDLFPDMVEVVTVAKPPEPIANQARPNTSGRNAGMKKVWDNTPEHWRTHALDVLWHIARHQAELTTDDLWDHLDSYPPGSHSIIGVIWQEAIRKRVVQKTSRTVKTRRQVANARDVPVYRSLIYSGVDGAVV